jgi:hypothetical protein
MWITLCWLGLIAAGAVLALLAVKWAFGEFL